jgi:hypothetical protein
VKILDPHEHLHGHVVVEHSYPKEYASLKAALTSVEVPLRAASPFSRGSRHQVPKRQKRAGTTSYKLLPVDQEQLNRNIAAKLRADDWRAQPIAATNLVAEGGSLRLKGDFVRNKVFVEVEFGNTASMFRDFFKFQVASRAGSGEVAVLVVATDRFARLFDSGVATFETARRLAPYLAIGLQMPIWICGIEPDDFSPIEARYGEMLKVCEANGVTCATYEEATRTRGPYTSNA